MKFRISHALTISALAALGSAPWALAADNAASNGASSTGSTIDYKAAYNACQRHPDSDKNVCKDQVGLRPASQEQAPTGTTTADVGSIRGQDKCARLTGNDLKECLTNENAGK